MAEIYLVRHGQASFTSDNYDQLSDMGREQSIRLGQYFAERNIEFDHIFTGTQHRHKQTADGILAAKTIHYDILPGLDEYDFSALYRAYMARHPDEDDISRHGDRRIFYQRLKIALMLWSGDKLSDDLPESWSDFSHRVANALRHIQEFSEGRCLVVSSGGPISMAIGHILDLAAYEVIDLNLQIKNSGFSHLHSGSSRLHLSSFNNIPHLDQPELLHMITYS